MYLCKTTRRVVLDASEISRYLFCCICNSVSFAKRSASDFKSGLIGMHHYEKYNKGYIIDACTRIYDRKRFK